MKKLFLAESRNFSPEALRTLRKHFQVEAADCDRAALLSRIADCHVLWVRLRNMIDLEVMTAAPNLQAIATNTTGLNHIDLEAAHGCDIRVVSLQGETDFLKTIHGTAEHALGLTLALLREIPAAHQHVLENHWDRTQFKGSEVFEKTVGIIGYGRLGSIVAGYFRALGADVLIHDVRLKAGESADSFRAVSLSDLLASADIISLHVAYEPANHHLLGKDEIEQMKPGAVLVNTSRGELIDEAALVNALRSEKLGGVALDVIESEHSPGESFGRLKSLAREGRPILFTPHIGGNTSESTQRTEVFLAEKLCSMLADKSESPRLRNP